MTYRFVKEQVLRLLNQFTMAGSPVPELYNNQQDYLSRIPGLVNDAMMEIATTYRKIPAVCDLDLLPCEDLGSQLRYRLPGNFYQLRSGDTVRDRDGRLLRTNEFSIHGGRCLLIPKENAGELRIGYYRYPVLLDEAPDDEDELDNVPETHFAIPYYVAAFLAAHDDPYLTTLFLNKYQDKLQKLLPDISAEVHPVSDAYGGGNP